MAKCVDREDGDLVVDVNTGDDNGGGGGGGDGFVNFEAFDDFNEVIFEKVTENLDRKTKMKKGSTKIRRVLGRLTVREETLKKTEI